MMKVGIRSDDAGTISEMKKSAPVEADFFSLVRPAWAITRW